MVAVSEQEFRGSRLLPPTARRRAGINHRWAEAEGHEGPRGLVGSGPVNEGLVVWGSRTGYSSAPHL
ncbi:hypothetical protein Pmani_012188 [Petrolisthes manimaculis]|uniref:Uncharacterized protein n=1 Tax=Petrolisthes manimaculis TaxID=1843537 RepID=A0AAE1PZQ3_9EUCA|nr:hypothetical protein Pmani_012188 [Petrolisthes manimaculis]